MNELYKEFVKERLGNKSTLGARTVEIRLVYQHDDIVRNLSFITAKLISKQIYSMKPNLSKLVGWLPPFLLVGRGNVHRARLRPTRDPKPAPATSKVPRSESLLHRYASQSY